MLQSIKELSRHVTTLWLEKVSRLYSPASCFFRTEQKQVSSRALIVEFAFVVHWVFVSRAFRLQA